jgi:hypothetical protein
MPERERCRGRLDARATTALAADLERMPAADGPPAGGRLFPAPTAHQRRDVKTRATTPLACAPTRPAAALVPTISPRH